MLNQGQDRVLMAMDMAVDMTMETVSNHAHLKIDLWVTVIAYIVTISLATTTSGIVNIAQSILISDAAVMFHSTTVKHAAALFHNTTILANVNIAPSITVKNAAVGFHHTTTSMFVIHNHANSHANNLASHVVAVKALVDKQLIDCVSYCQTGRNFYLSDSIFPS